MSRKQRRRHEKRRRHSSEPRLTRRNRIITGAGVGVGATLLMGGAAQAACTCTVETLSEPTDAGATTLRDAINSSQQAANAGSTITFASGLTGTITLQSQLPEIVYPTTIQGPGADKITISGNDAHRIMFIDLATDHGAVNISGLTFTGGHAENTVRNGGAIFNTNSDLTVSDSVLSGNKALGNTPNDGYGGAICTCYNEGHLTVRNSTLAGNTAGGSGGAIYDDESPVTLQNVTLSGNHAYFRGGGISVSVPQPGSSIENSTLANNTVTTTQTDSGYGGGGLFLYTDPQGFLVPDSTIAGNSAVNGGGIQQHGSGYAQPLALRNTIVATNSASGSGPDLGGEFNSAFSLIESTAGATVTEATPGSDITAQDPQLTALANNGGPTETMKPTFTSPAIDKGATFGFPSDQRGSPRPVEIPTIPNSGAAGADGSDIGAYELPSNVFTVKGVKGKKLILELPAAGTVQVVGIKGKKKKRSADATVSKSKKSLKISSGSGGPGTIKIALKLTKAAAKKLKQAGKLKLKAAITFSPTGGWPATQNAKLKLKTKKRKK